VSSSPVHPSGATGPRKLALTLSSAYLVIAAAIGTVLLVTAGDGDPASPEPSTTVGAGQWEQLPPGSDLNLGRTTTTTATTTTTTSTTTAVGYDQVQTRAGMSTVVPAGWSVAPCASGNGCEQSNDPSDTTRFLRFGGSPSPIKSLSDTQTSYERDFAKRTGYQRLTFESGSLRGYASVAWEFEWDSGGNRRHVQVMYWRANGYDYFVYASSTVDKWVATGDIFQNMLSYSTP
jgi:hypothetical protein